MLYAAQANRAHPLVAILVSCYLGILAPASSVAQTPDGVVPITSEPDHKIRFDNGRVRMYELVLPKGKTTLVHEHRADSFTVFFRTTEVTNEAHRGKAVVFKRTAGDVAFTSTAKGPYSHRVFTTGETTFHVIAMELMSPTPAGSATATQRPSPAFKVALENPRGRVYRVTMAPGESTGTFTRPAGSALFAISAGRISETVDGKPVRLWDFEPGHFRWFEMSEKLSVKNESSTPIDLVEIELF
jgi:mannose-6-phosphate isomerase-like protein (cupin superfamily)